VGAAVLVGGQIYGGCNIENSSYDLTICADQVIFRVIASTQDRHIQAIPVTCPDAPPIRLRGKGCPVVPDTRS
jgi:cytidine deaminase